MRYLMILRSFLLLNNLLNNLLNCRLNGFQDARKIKKDPTRSVRSFKCTELFCLFGAFCSVYLFVFPILGRGDPEQSTEKRADHCGSLGHFGGIGESPDRRQSDICGGQCRKHDHDDPFENIVYFVFELHFNLHVLCCSDVILSC